MNADFLYTSGHLQADRRYDYAMQLLERDDLTAALELLQQTAEIAPDWPVVPFCIGNIHAQMGQKEEAMSAYKQTLALDPDDHQGALLKIQLLGHHVIERAMPSAFVETLFDQYAPRFDEHLVQTLEYSVPQRIHALYTAQQPQRDQLRILDLGCGTGLAGEYFAANAAWLEGVDLSSGMLHAAEEKGIYNRLTHADLLSYLNDAEDKFDLILAADVLIYLGEMQAVFKAAKARLLPHGTFIFSLQKQSNEDLAEDFTLDETHRFSHNKEYIQRTLQEAGLATLRCEETILRKDRDSDVHGYIYMCGQDSALALETDLPFTALAAQSKTRLVT